MAEMRRRCVTHKCSNVSRECHCVDHYDMNTCISLIYTYRVTTSDPLENCTGFDWDDTNVLKNWERHRVTPEEAEDIFFQQPLVVRGDVRHSVAERRYYALGRTGKGRHLFVAFTVRGQSIRVISARDMNRNEKDIYARHEKNNPEV